MIESEVQHGDSRELLSILDFTMKPTCVITDPPYGVDFTSFRAQTKKGKEFTRKIENDGNLEQALELFDEVMSLLLPRTASEADLYVFTKWDIIRDWEPSVSAMVAQFGFLYKMLLVWDKGIPGMGDLDGNWGCGHELIMYFKRGRRPIPERRSAIIHADKLGSKQHIHPTEKPVALIQTLIRMSTDEGDLVVDPFAGSGSTIVAAQNLGRVGLGIEIDAEYAKAANDRLRQTTIF